MLHVAIQGASWIPSYASPRQERLVSMTTLGSISGVTVPAFVAWVVIGAFLLGMIGLFRLGAAAARRERREQRWQQVKERALDFEEDDP